MRTQLAAAAVVLGAMVAFSTPAQATTAGECQGLIAVLSTDTETATTLTARARTSLVDKAEAAAAKLASGKTGDASAKLADYEATLVDLHSAAKPKVGEADFVLLKGDVDAAIGCVAAIETL